MSTEEGIEIDYISEKQTYQFLLKLLVLEMIHALCLNSIEKNANPIILIFLIKTSVIVYLYFQM